MNSAVEGRILLLGDGDFSLSSSLLKYNSPQQMTSTSFETEHSIQKHKNAFINRDLLVKLGVEVLFQVDACCLHSNPDFKDKSFQRIIFNFPHVGGKSNHKKNRKLLSDFFCSAVTVLHPNGQMMVTLCKGQGGTPADRPQRAWHDSWQVVSMAANAGLILSEMHQFSPEDFPGYFCTGFRSQDKWFHIEGALTHVFSRSPPVPVPEVSGCRAELPSVYSRNLLEEDGHPLSNLYKELVEKFKSFWSSRVVPLSDILSEQNICSNIVEIKYILADMLQPADEMLLSYKQHVNLENSFSTIPVGFQFISVMRYNELSPTVEKLECLLGELCGSSLSENKLKIEEQLQAAEPESESNLNMSHVILLDSEEIGKIYLNRDNESMCIILNLCKMFCSVCNLPDQRLIWSTDQRFLSQFSDIGAVCSVKFLPFSLYPVTFYHDMSFWESQVVKFDERKYLTIIHNITAGVVRHVEQIDAFSDGDRTSRCYRLTFQSCDRGLSYDVSWRLQSMVRLVTAKLMDIKLR